MQQLFLRGVVVVACGLAGPWLGAQTAPTGPVPPVASSGAGQSPPPGVDLTVPLNNPRNRNPARRSQWPDTAPTPPDPRDSTTRPVMPPGHDERDTVLPTPDTTPAPRSTLTRPAVGAH